MPKTRQSLCFPKVVGRLDGRFPTKTYAQRNYFKAERPFPIQLSRRSPKPSQPFWPQKPAAFCQSPENHTQKPPKWQTDQRQLQVRWRGQPKPQPQPKSQPSEDSRQRQPGSVVGRAARKASAGFLEYELLKPVPKLADYARKGTGCYPKFLRQDGRSPSITLASQNGRSQPNFSKSPKPTKPDGRSPATTFAFQNGRSPSKFSKNLTTFTDQPAAQTPKLLPAPKRFARNWRWPCQKSAQQTAVPAHQNTFQRANWLTDRPSLAAALPKTRQSLCLPKVVGRPDGRFPTKLYAQRNYFQGERPFPIQLSRRSPKPRQPCRP